MSMREKMPTGFRWHLMIFASREIILPYLLDQANRRAPKPNRAGTLRRCARLSSGTRHTDEPLTPAYPSVRRQRILSSIQAPVPVSKGSGLGSKGSTSARARAARLVADRLGGVALPAEHLGDEAGQVPLVLHYENTHRR
jgi:hypothetical protein